MFDEFDEDNGVLCVSEGGLVGHINTISVLYQYWGHSAVLTKIQTRPFKDAIFDYTQKPEAKKSGYGMFPDFGCPVFGSTVTNIKTE